MTEESIRLGNTLVRKIEELRKDHELYDASESDQTVQITTRGGNYRTIITKVEWETLLMTAKDRLLSNIEKCKEELEKL